MTSTPVEKFNSSRDLPNPQDNKPTDHWSKKSSRTTEFSVQEDLQEISQTSPEVHNINQRATKD